MSNVLINGISARYVDVMDRGLHYGDGLFETILYAGGRLQFWEQHIARMSAGARKLGIRFPGEQCFFDDISKLTRHSQHQDSIIKLVLTRGSGEIGGYHCWAEFYLRGYGWVPVDTSEGWKQPEKRDFLSSVSKLPK